MVEEKISKESIGLVEVATQTSKVFQHSTGKIMTMEEVIVEMFNDIKAIRKNI